MNFGKLLSLLLQAQASLKAITNGDSIDGGRQQQINNASRSLRAISDEIPRALQQLESNNTNVTSVMFSSNATQAGDLRGSATQSLSSSTDLYPIVTGVMNLATVIDPSWVPYASTTPTAVQLKKDMDQFIVTLKNSNGAAPGIGSVNSILSTALQFQSDSARSTVLNQYATMLFGILEYPNRRVQPTDDGSQPVLESLKKDLKAHIFKHKNNKQLVKPTLHNLGKDLVSFTKDINRVALAVFQGNVPSDIIQDGYFGSASAQIMHMLQNLGASTDPVLISNLMKTVIPLLEQYVIVYDHILLKMGLLQAHLNGQVKLTSAQVNDLTTTIYRFSQAMSFDGDSRMYPPGRPIGSCAIMFAMAPQYLQVAMDSNVIDPNNSGSRLSLLSQVMSAIAKVEPTGSYSALDKIGYSYTGTNQNAGRRLEKE